MSSIIKSVFTVSLFSLLVLSCSSPITGAELTQSETSRSFTGSSTYPSMNLRGSFNSWGTQAMTLVDNYTWETEVTLAAGAQFKFDAYGNWGTNFGDNNGDYIADQNGSNISVAAAGTYVVRFNDQSKAYSVNEKVVLIQTDVYAVPDRSTIISEWDLSGLSMNIYKSDNTLERTSPITVTTRHGSYAPLRNPGIAPGSYTAVVDQIVDGYRYTGETSFTITGSSSPSPSMVISKSFSGGTGDVYWTLEGAYGPQVTILNGLTAQLFKDSQFYKDLPIEGASHQQPWTAFSDLPEGNYSISVNEVKNNVKYQGTQTFQITEVAPHVNFSVSVTGTPQDFAKTYDQVYLRGTFNGWASTEMRLVGDYTWERTVSFAYGDVFKAFKFDVFGDWSLNFGDNNMDGTADQNGSDIPMSLSLNVTIRFNDQTKAYSFYPGGSTY